MIKSKAYEYFITQDHNCAESSLLAIRDAYGLDIGPEEMKLVSAFGGGMGCGMLCGVLSGSMAALGRRPRISARSVPDSARPSRPASAVRNVRN